MKIDHNTSNATAKEREEIEGIANQSVAKCYQCGKCFAGCPMASAMDISPTQVMRLAQLGQVDKILQAKTIWICSACETCTTRCPQEVDIARVMDGLRNLAFKKGGKAASNKIALAHKLFITNMKIFGRSFEPVLILLYNVFSFKFFKIWTKRPRCC